jgi:hypothetical protein
MQEGMGPKEIKLFEKKQELFFANIVDEFLDTSTKLKALFSGKFEKNLKRINDKN